MGIIRHLGRTVNSGSAFTPAVPTSRTFYFSEGSNGAALNENVIWYVDGASTNDQYPYTYNATAEFTAELRFQNGYTISSVNDVVLSNDFSDPQYEWSISKSLNAGGDILTLTFTPDADDFNGNPVTIAVDENNTVVIDPTPPYEQYNPVFGEITQMKNYLEKNGGVTFGGANPGSYETIYGHNHSRMESTNFSSSGYVRWYSELDANGYPTIGSYARSTSGIMTGAGYDVLYGPGGWVYNNAAATDTTNFTEDGVNFNFKNIVRYEVADNGYSYVAEIIPSWPISEPSNPSYGGSAILELREGEEDGMSGNTYYTTQNTNYFGAAAVGDNSLTFRHDMSNKMGNLRNSVTKIHLSADGINWDIYDVLSFSGDVITINGTFGREIDDAESTRFTVEGDLDFNTATLGSVHYNSMSGLRNTLLGNIALFNNFYGQNIFKIEGEYSLSQFLNKKAELRVGNTLGGGTSPNNLEYAITEIIHEMHPTQGLVNSSLFYAMEPSVIDFAPTSISLFFPAS